MLKKIKLIQGIGNYTKTIAGGVDFGDVTVIYGENRNGKSTLCDVMHSLSEDSPDFIMHRKSIPHDQTKPPKVELMFVSEARNITTKFENEQWQNKSPSDSTLYVFDHSFIHRNVITGQKLERPNSENMTSFILGESNTALFTALAGLNTNLRGERALLSGIERQFTPHAVNALSAYVNSAMPVETAECLEKSLEVHDNSEKQIRTTIQDIEKIKQRNTLASIGTQVYFDQVINSINTVLTSSLQNVHQHSLEALNNHLSYHVNNSATFKGWASQGVPQIKDSCPFCGQHLSTDAQHLIAAYQQTFNSEFDSFNQQTRQTLNNLRQPFLVPNNRDSLIQQHHSNQQVFDLYVEPQITNNQALLPLITLLNEKQNVVLSSFDALTESSSLATSFWSPKLEQKYSTPYEPAAPVGFDALNSAAATYNQAIYDYWTVAEQVNEIFNTFKTSINEAALNEKLAEITQKKIQINSALKRISLEPLCLQYREKLATVNALNAAYIAQKKQLEHSQTTYLNTYFELINNLFRELGSDDFVISKAPNNRGKQIIYDLRVKFKNEDIPIEKINIVFSESDRRALALCIFLAKVISLPEEEKSKAILVMDDPVTSFDNERITLILNKLEEIHRNTKQLIITTHYKGMASKAVKKFKHNAKAIKLIQGNQTCAIESVEIDDMTATAHDIAFDKIKAFINRETHDDIVTTLRPFFEAEIRYRFKKQLIDLGEVKSDLSTCIISLRNHNFITADIEARLNTIRDALNTPMHEIGDSSLENTRALASQILNLVYNEL